MLRYPVKSLLTDPSQTIRVEEELLQEPLTVGGDRVTFLEPCHIDGQLRNIGDGIILFTGTLNTVVRMACSRCVKDTELPLSAAVEQRYIAERQQDAMQEDMEIFRNEVVDLNELIYSEIRMAIPMKVLCREDCKGLCPICGKDLNEGPCGCGQDTVDPRWEALKGLLKDE